MANIRANTQILPNTISDDLFMDHRWKRPIRLLELSTNLSLSNGATIDSVAVVTGDRVGVFGQTTTSENGVYLVDTAGAWTRTDDFELGDTVAGSSFVVEEGTVYGNSTHIITSNDGADVVGTNGIVSAQTGGTGSIYSADNGLNKLGSTVEIGGTLNKNTVIDKNTQTFYVNGEGAIQLEDDNGGTAQVSRIAIDWSSIYMRHYGTTGQFSRFLIDQTNMTFTDNINNKGCIYAADYSTNFENESLVTKRYVDNLINGRQWKEPVRALIDGTNVLGNQALTGAATIDGVVLATGDRVGLFDQTATAEDGVYIVDTTGAWTRSSDWASNNSAANYTFYVQEGTINADYEFTVTNDSGSDVVGVNDLVVKATGGQATITAGAGMIRNTNAFDIQTADLSLTVNADNMAVNIGNTNGTSLEVTATGLELSSTVTGARTFTQGIGELFTINNTDTNGPRLAVDPDGTVPLAIATTNYVDSAITSNTLVAGDGLVNTAGTFDVVAANASLIVNANNMAVQAGTTNGNSLETTATGLELRTQVTGLREFTTNGYFRVYTNGGLLTLDSQAGGTNITSTATITIGTSSDNAVLTNQPTGGTALAIATTGYVDTAISNAREYNEATTLNIGGQTATLSSAPTTGFVNGVVYLNGIRQILTTDYTVTNAATGEITFTAAQPIIAGDVVIMDYNDA